MYYNSQYEHSEKDLFPAPTDRIIAKRFTAQAIKPIVKGTIVVYVKKFTWQ